MMIEKNVPMIISESWPPIWRLQNGVHEADNINECIAHQEEEIEDLNCKNEVIFS